jgi:hypothetical protein
MKLIAHLHIVLRLRILELYLHSPVCFHGIVVNCIIKYRDNLTLLCIEFWWEIPLKLPVARLRRTYRFV